MRQAPYALGGGLGAPRVFIHEGLILKMFLYNCGRLLTQLLRSHEPCYWFIRISRIGGSLCFLKLIDNKLIILNEFTNINNKNGFEEYTNHFSLKFSRKM